MSKPRILFAAALLLTSMTSAMSEQRLPDIPRDAMTPDQKAAADATVSGPRKTLGGPFNIWLRSPKLENILQQTGQYVRFDTSLPHKLNEFAILITGVQWQCPYEWSYHYPIALKEGMDPKVLEELSTGVRPQGMTDDEVLIYDFSVELHQKKQVSDALYNAMIKRFGERGVLDLIAVNGYYALVSMTLNVGRVPADKIDGPSLKEAALPQ